MRASTKRMAKGVFHEVRGTAKKIVGAVTANRTLGAKGKLERVAGKVQRKIGKTQAICGF